MIKTLLKYFLIGAVSTIIGSLWGGVGLIGLGLVFGFIPLLLNAIVLTWLEFKNNSEQKEKMRPESEKLRIKELKEELKKMEES